MRTRNGPFRWQLGTTVAASTAVLALLAGCSSGSSSSAGQASTAGTTSAATSAAASAAATTAAAGSSAAPASSSGTSSAASTAGTPSTAAASLIPAGKTVPLTAIPASVRDNYAGYDSFSKLFGNPYASWTPPPAPWKFCESTSYTGNTWEQGTQAEFTKLVKEAQTMGLAKGALTVADSNGTIALQISQLNNLVDDGCNVIFSVPGSPTASSRR
jgi:ABC-type sugar transport system substrate-binding protein